MNSTDDRLRAEVREELAREPRLDARQIAVRVREGVVILRGTVGSPAQKRSAQEAAARVGGVVAVDNELQVRPLDMHERADAELRAQVLQALIESPFVPPSVDAASFGGVVTLRGSVRGRFQRDEAELVARKVHGVRGVRNELSIVRGPTVAEVDDAIASALQRNARLDAAEIEVETTDGTVTLLGTVGSWEERDAAIEAARAAPGVEAVHDHLWVVPEG
jgi:osmotically-inducible protein OsmY